MTPLRTTPLCVLSVASEVFPLVKTGGLADVTGALPGALEAEGIAVRTLIPGYPAVTGALADARVIHHVTDLFGGPAWLVEARAAGLDLLVLDAPHLYARPGNPYLDPDGRDWPDNALRFAALGWAAAEIGGGAIDGYAPDVVHAHDWQGGLAPAYLHFRDGAGAAPIPVAESSDVVRPSPVMAVARVTGPATGAGQPSMPLPAARKEVGEGRPAGNRQAQAPPGLGPLTGEPAMTGDRPSYSATGMTPGRLRPATVMTIHNLAFPGKQPSSLLATLGLPPSAYAIDGVEFYGTISLLKAGLQFADRITTVSPTYAAEIQTAAAGMGFDGLLRARAVVLSGILNGIDTNIWNPATDQRIATRYDRATLDKRAANKAALQARMGLAVDPDAPLFGVVSRLTWQKGMDLLLACMPTLLALGGQLALLGSGDASIEAGFQSQAAATPARVGCVVGYDEALAHGIQAGADALLVPSRFEPCGLT